MSVQKRSNQQHTVPQASIAAIIQALGAMHTSVKALHSRPELAVTHNTVTNVQVPSGQVTTMTGCMHLNVRFIKNAVSADFD